MENQQRRKKKKKKNKAVSVVLTIVFIAALICFIGSAGYLIKYYYDGYKAEKNITGLENMIISEAETEVQTDESGNEHVVSHRYDDLYEANRDFIGWVSVDGTPLSYPVMYTPQDGEYYLHRNFEKEYEYSGLPFIDARCSVKPATQNIIIYGHNMSNDTMFSTMMDYKDKSYFEAHPYIDFNTIYGDGKYEIAFVILAKAYREGEEGFRYYDFVEPSAKEDFDKTIEAFKKLSIYDTGVTVSEEDEFITLSTCEYSQKDGRMAIIARKVR